MLDDMACRVIDNGQKSAAENMQQDALLLSNLTSEEGIVLHLYDWQSDAATFGHFNKVETHLNMKSVEKAGLDLARRPTGGGIVFHNCDLAFSVLVPASHPGFSTNTLENYAFINERVKKVINMFHGSKSDENLELLKKENSPVDNACTHFCMAHPTKYDVMIEGRKVGGSAQRRTKMGFLHQGSIFIGQLPYEYLDELLQPQTRVLEGMLKSSYPLIQGKWTKKDLIEARQELRVLLKRVFSEEFYV